MFTSHALVLGNDFFLMRKNVSNSLHPFKIFTAGSKGRCLGIAAAICGLFLVENGEVQRVLNIKDIFYDIV